MDLVSKLRIGGQPNLEKLKSSMPAVKKKELTCIIIREILSISWAITLIIFQFRIIT